ncbi:MAG: type II secretion system protein [Acidobacteriota bacterium]
MTKEARTGDPVTNKGGNASVLRRPYQAGFTLLELLVSITLMGIVAVAIQTGFRLGVRSWEKGEAALQRFRAAQAALDLITRQLGSMLPYYTIQRYNDVPVEVLVFQGADRGLRFVSAFSVQSRTAGGLRYVEYFLTPSTEGRGTALVVQERELPGDDSFAESVFTGFSKGEGDIVVAGFPSFSAGAEAIPLLEGVEDMEFRYLAPPPEETNVPNPFAPPKKRQRLPMGVEIRWRWLEPPPASGFPLESSVVIPISAAL